MPYSLKFKLAFKLTVSFLFIVINTTFAQDIKRQTICCFGSSLYTESFTVQQCIGQPSTTKSGYGLGSFRSGFIQPINLNLIDEPTPKFLVYPNPTHEIITISGDIESFDIIILYTVNGILVRRITPSITTNDLSFSISDLPSGVYSLTFLQGETLITTTKIIKL